MGGDDAARVAAQAGSPRIESIDGGQLEQLVAAHVGSLPADLQAAGLWRRHRLILMA